MPKSFARNTEKPAVDFLTQNRCSPGFVSIPSILNPGFSQNPTARQQQPQTQYLLSFIFLFVFLPCLVTDKHSAPFFFSFAAALRILLFLPRRLHLSLLVPRVVPAVARPSLVANGVDSAAHAAVGRRWRTTGAPPELCQRRTANPIATQHREQQRRGRCTSTCHTRLCRRLCQWSAAHFEPE